MKKYYRRIYLKIFTFAFVIFVLTLDVFSQQVRIQVYERDSLITAAREMIAETRYCALITLDKSSHPQARTMDPFLPQEDMVIWMGTNPQSRKVDEIKNDPRVTLYYEIAGGGGYVVLKGQAQLVDDPELKSHYWKKEWEQFYPDQNKNYTLIKMIPKRLELVDYKRGFVGDSKTWAAPSVEFDAGHSKK
jgi:general stress protein 26